MNVSVKEEILDEVVVKEEQSENSETVPLSGSVFQPNSPITLRCLKKEQSDDGGDTVECSCKECTGTGWVRGEGGHQVKVKFEEENETLPTSTNVYANLPDDNINSFFGDDDEEQLNEEVNYNCDICPASFPYSVQLTVHQRIHAETQPNQCPLCRKTFSQLAQFAKHRQFHKHDQCTICWKIFPKRAQLLKHSEAGCKAKKVFPCTECEAVFTNKTLLSGHQRTHIVKEPPTTHQCTECERIFSAKFQLISHMRKHTRELPFQCAICLKSFAEKSNLKKHEKTHLIDRPRPYPCNTCGKAFHTKWHLLEHERIHDGIKPYTCSICQRDFTTGNTLQTHSFTHQINRPRFICPTRGWALTHKSRLNKHQLFPSEPYTPNRLI